MTNELEKQFFDTFGIEKVTAYSCYEYYTYERNIDIWGEHCEKYVKDGGKCDDCNYKKFIREYPQITDRILLELICILTRFYGEIVLESCTNNEDLKEQILRIFTRTSYKDNFKHQVRTLFEEG